MWGRGAIRAALSAAVAGALALTVAGTTAPASARGDGGHGFGRMGPLNARTTTVSPSAGPDFELPFICGTRWTGSTRSGHSPSSYTVDFNAANDFNQPVLASAPGVVTRAQSLTTSYGRHIIIDHGNGYTTLYAHLNKLAAVVGQVVDQGELIGYLGTTGNSTGPHLHFEQRRSGAYFRPYFHRQAFNFGATWMSLNCNDKPVAGDFDGDGKDDVAVFRNRNFGGRFYFESGTKLPYVPWGVSGDVPAVGDYDGDGTSQVGVRKMGSGTWHLRSKDGRQATVTGVGVSYDTPITGDWDGNGRDGLGFYRPSTHRFYLRADNHALTSITWGADGDQAVTGDWDGDGTTDIGVFNPSTRTWTLRVPKGTGFVTQRIVYGAIGDNMPVTGDWDGDRKTDVGVWRPSLARFHVRTLSSAGKVLSHYRYLGEKRN